MADAAAAQNVDAMTEMLGRGQDPNAQDADGNTALHWASWFRIDAMVTRLLEDGVRLDVANVSGETPVHWAAKSSNIHALTAMMQRDYGVLSQRDCDGFTPFIILAQSDNAPIMEWMFLKGTSVEEQDKWGRTALQWACYKGHRRTVQWLLSRFADISHRDHEGMTAVHWAALKGHEAVCEMLINVGAVNLLDVPDSVGDTPIRLAHRKKNRYLVMSFFKCRLFNYLFGRPNIARNNFASLFVVFVVFNFFVFALIIAPRIFSEHPLAVFGWVGILFGTMFLWLQACLADPGWLGEETIVSQDDRCMDPVEAFDAHQPIESQMEAAHPFNHMDDAELAKLTLLERLEEDQKRYNSQRHLVAKARMQLEDGMSSSASTALLKGTASQASQKQQLDHASFDLRERMRVTGESLGHERTARLAQRGGAEYTELLDKGHFKQVCVVCRVRRGMRSHHCKECGRCVQRLDHHCPWIDNCVGLGNQRIFYCFVVALLVTIVGFYYVCFLYMYDHMIETWDIGVRGFLTVFSNGSIGPVICPILVITAIVFDLVWLAFVSALVARHTAYMAVNVTTYEVLVRPAHMQRRFPKGASSRLWWLKDFGLGNAVMNCLRYWTQNTDHDVIDFAATDGFSSMPDTYAGKS